ncbi:hypothetical protein U1Q18_016405 [Sarracenia purpurea var. burkii]
MRRFLSSSGCNLNGPDLSQSVSPSFAPCTKIAGIVFSVQTRKNACKSSGCDSSSASKSPKHVSFLAPATSPHRPPLLPHRINLALASSLRLQTQKSPSEHLQKKPLFRDLIFSYAKQTLCWPLFESTHGLGFFTVNRR